MTDTAASAAVPEAGRTQEPIKVMIVDDSAVVRGLLARWLEAAPGIQVVRSVREGAQAIKHVAACNPDVVILDVDMPVMDGLQALPQIIAARPGVKVIMSSTLTRRNAEISLRALELGAADYIPKPDTIRGLTTAEDFGQELVMKVRALGGAAREASPPQAAKPVTGGAVRTTADARPAAQPMRLRAIPAILPSVVALGSSTGGPQALMTFFKHLPPTIQQPVFVTQHMPPTFTSILAEHLMRASGREAKEAVDGEIVQERCIYIAPGGLHLNVERENTNIRIRLSDEPSEHFCRPAVDPMFRSLAKVYGANILAIVLTGMGRDGCEGARWIAEAGGAVFAQDAESSVVWGMPGAVAQAGLASFVAPVPELASKTQELIRGAHA